MALDRRPFHRQRSPQATHPFDLIDFGLRFMSTIQSKLRNLIGTSTFSLPWTTYLRTPISQTIEGTETHPSSLIIHTPFSFMTSIANLDVGGQTKTLRERDVKMSGTMTGQVFPGPVLKERQQMSSHQGRQEASRGSAILDSFMSNTKCNLQATALHKYIIPPYPFSLPFPTPNQSRFST